MRSFRFGISRARATDRAEWIDFVDRGVSQGFDTILVPDHLGALSPAVAIAIAAERAPSLRMGPFVLNNDFRHPVVVAQEAASLDLLTDGRYELGLGTGWNVPEYRESGIRSFDSGAVRVDRLKETVQILRRLFAGEEVSWSGEHYRLDAYRQQPLPAQGAALPILIGGNGNRVLQLAAAHADIVNFTGFGHGPGGIRLSHFTKDGLAERVRYLSNAAGERASAIELSMLVQHAEVTDDPERRATELAAEWAMGPAPGMTAEDVLASPFIQLGTADALADALMGIREDLGVTYFAVFDGERSEGFHQVVERLKGR